MTSLKVVSLFAGAGGIELGLERTGMQTVGQVEMDPYCNKVLGEHWPDVPRHLDMETAVTWWLSEPRPVVDVVCGGFPCQPFSLAGKQLGMNDDRWMWPAMFDFVRNTRPRYVLVENVSALVRNGRAFGRVLADLHSLGFDAEWATLRASEFGAPHRRERVYVLAYPAGINGQSRDLLGQGRERQAPIPTRGLSGLAIHQQRAAARQWLDGEPRVDRLADGIPFQVDRLRLAGNAVVPAVAESIGRLIQEHDAALMETAA